MINRIVAALAAPLALAACATPSAPPAPAAQRPVLPVLGLERVMGKDARALTALFGEPDLDVREAPARKLQFLSPACVLDAYLYPPAAGRDAVVTWLDARTPAGGDFDRASCVAALMRRPQAR